MTYNKFKTIKNLLPKGYFNNKIITLDIETRCENDLIIPYAISYLDLCSSNPWCKD